MRKGRKEEGNNKEGEEKGRNDEEGKKIRWKEGMKKGMKKRIKE